MDNMKHIALIACSKSKQGQNDPARKFKAQDIYTGNTFKLAKTEGIRRFGCEDFHILSSKYYLLDKDDEISYYDMYLGSQSASYKKMWAGKVISALKAKYDIENTIFYIFGGHSYYENLTPHLNCVVFGYISSSKIDLEKPTEYKNGGK